MLTSLQGGDDARERGVLQFTTAWTHFFASPSAEPFQWINNFGLKVQGIEAHTYERQFIQVCDESGKGLALSRRRHWTAKGFCVRPPMEATEEDGMDSAHFQFAASKRNT